MKKWIVEFLALIISMSSQNVLHGAEDHLPPVGVEIVQLVEDAYQKGDYNNFLNKLHEQYQNAGKAGALRGIFESAKAAMQITPEKITENRQRYRAGIRGQNQDRNQRLLDAIAANPSLAIVQRIDSIAFFSQSEEESAALIELENLKFHIPETEESTIENQISALETEYYIKSLLLDVGSHHGKTNTDTTNKKIAITLEKLDKMEDAAKKNQNIIWLEKVRNARAAFLSEKAYRIDLNTLNELASGKIAAENSVEEKVKEIMMDYQ
ncbi:MAG: hypothetical protein KR126chlam3_01379 [Chlamydiae bacterium]|nr:hypothetical protein [Chlamydiota bacterium]